MSLFLSLFVCRILILLRFTYDGDSRFHHYHFFPANSNSDHPLLYTRSLTSTNFIWIWPQAPDAIWNSSPFGSDGGGDGLKATVKIRHVGEPVEAFVTASYVPPHRHPYPYYPSDTQQPRTDRATQRPSKYPHNVQRTPKSRNPWPDRGSLR